MLAFMDDVYFLHISCERTEELNEYESQGVNICLLSVVLSLELLRRSIGPRADITSPVRMKGVLAAARSL